MLGTAASNTPEFEDLKQDAQAIVEHLNQRFYRGQEALFYPELRPDLLAKVENKLPGYNKPEIIVSPNESTKPPETTRNKIEKAISQGQVVPLDETSSMPVVAMSNVATGKKVLWAVLRTGYRACGLEELEHTGILPYKQAVALRQMVLGRIIQPCSKEATKRLLDGLGDIGEDVVSLKTMFRCLKQVGTDRVREYIFNLFLEHANEQQPVNFVLYDVTTLYFEIEKEDEPQDGKRASGYSKERRLEPQIKLGLFTDKAGRPLYVESFNGNDGEINTFMPILRKFIDITGICDITVVADSGMISYTNLIELDRLGFKFIIGSKRKKIPYDLAFLIEDNVLNFVQDQVVDTITPRHGNYKVQAEKDAGERWDPEVDVKTFRAVWRCSSAYRKRMLAQIDQRVQKAKKVVANPSKSPRVVYVGRDKSSKLFLQEDKIAWDRSTAGLKGYVTNIPASVLSAGDIVSAYHDLWHIEQSFRISKTDLKARPIYHSKDVYIEGHLVVVSMGLLVARWLCDTTGVTAKRVVELLSPVVSVSGVVGGSLVVFDPLADLEQGEWGGLVRVVKQRAGYLVV